MRKEISSMTNDKDSEDALTIAYLLGVKHGRAEQNTQTDALKAAGAAIRGLLDITSEYNLDSEQAGRAYAALHEIGTALAALEQSK
jgi:hypothetical protein